MFSTHPENVKHTSDFLYAPLIIKGNKQCFTAVLLSQVNCVCVRQVTEPLLSLNLEAFGATQLKAHTVLKKQFTQVYQGPTMWKVAQQSYFYTIIPLPRFCLKHFQLVCLQKNLFKKELVGGFKKKSCGRIENELTKTQLTG